MDGDGLSSLGEKGKVRTFVSVAVKFFYIVDQLLMRSLWLEKLSINDFAINSDFHIILLLKDQTNHYHITHWSSSASMSFSGIHLTPRY